MPMSAVSTSLHDPRRRRCPKLLCHPMPPVSIGPAHRTTRLHLLQRHGFRFGRFGKRDGHGRFWQRHDDRHGRLGKVRGRAGVRGRRRSSAVWPPGRCSQRVFARVVEQDLATGHLAASSQLVGTLLPHRHLDLVASVTAVGESIGGLLLAAIRAPFLLLLRRRRLSRVRTAPVDGSLSVEVRSSTPSARTTHTT